MSRGFFSFVLVIGVCASLLAGCGGGDSAPTKAAFLKEGNAICKKGEEERAKMLQELTKKIGFKASQPVKEKAVTELMGTYEKTSEELAELDPPAGDEERMDEILEERENSEKKVEADPNTAMTSKVQFEKANEVATEYGLKKCIL